MQSTQTQLLSQDVDDEQWNVHGIPPQKTARVGAKAEGPFQPGSLQVSRRLRDDSSVHIERGTNSDQYGRIESVAMRRHPALLLWRAEADRVSAFLFRVRFEEFPVFRTGVRGSLGRTGQLPERPP
jgi:hypothetical protein